MRAEVIDIANDTNLVKISDASQYPGCTAIGFD